MDSDLYLAVVDDKIGVLKRKDWVGVQDQLTPANNTVLHLACRHGSISCVKEILGRADKSLLLQINSRGETALHLAARQGHYDAVKELINKAKSSDPEPNNLKNASSTVVQNLIRAPNAELETALHAAVRFDHKKVVELLVKEDPSYSYPQNKYGETPLYLAAVRCYDGITKVILDNCESPTFGGPGGRTALHAALMSRWNTGYECMRLLLEKNGDLIKKSDSNGWTAFHYMAHNGLLVWMKFLLDKDKAVAYLADKRYKRTAIHVAAYKGHVPVLRELLEYLPDAWESVDGNGHNILHIAVKQDQKPVIDFIFSEIRRFDTLNTLFVQRDKEGNTPFHLIAKFGYQKFGYQIPEMIRLNYDWDAVDDTNLTPAQVLYQKHKGTLVDEELVGVTVDRHDVICYWGMWTRGKAPKKEDPETPKEKIKRYRQMANTHMIVTALITTVALTAGFAMPGGFDDNQGPNKGSPLLLGKAAFKTFMVADTIALLFSISSLFLYFLTSFKLKAEVIFNMLICAIVLNVVSIAAMMVAFIAGTFAVLSQSIVLAVSVCIISSLFLLLIFSICFIHLRRMSRAIKLRLGPNLYQERKELWDV